jgi:hypothetical protein
MRHSMLLCSHRANRGVVCSAAAGGRRRQGVATTLNPRNQVGRTIPKRENFPEKPSRLTSGTKLDLVTAF